MLASKWAPKPAAPAESAKPEPAKQEPARETVPTADPAPTSEKPAEAQPTFSEPSKAETAQSEPLPVENASGSSYEDMSYGYDYADPSIDPFAQTAGTDDLFFDDDIVPVAEPVVEEHPVEREQEPESQTEPDIHQPSQHAPRGPANGERGGRGGRGRGNRGRRGGRGGSNNESREKEVQKEKDVTETTTEISTAPTEASTEATSVPEDAPKEPKAPRPAGAVRGDRSATGGPKRPRLTEEELNAKMAAINLKNSALTTAHERAEADQASFEAREALAAQKQQERKKQLAERQKADRQNRQQMMGEREKNRQRKLDALKGREWDFEKEDGFSGTGEERRAGAARGAYGGVAPTPRKDTSGWAHDDAADNTQTGTPSNRGGAHRGRGRGRGRGEGNFGRGAHNGTTETGHGRKQQEQQPPPRPADFPELPPSSANASTDKTNAPPPSTAPKKLDFPVKTKVEAIKTDVKESEPERPGVKKQESFGLSPAVPGKSWADQIDD